MNIKYSGEFPKQRVSDKEKDKVEWYAPCCDYIISKGTNIRDMIELDEKYDVLDGRIPKEYYEKTLNPFHVEKDWLQRFPATMRNYDMIKGAIRRFVGEYTKKNHSFIVKANNADVVLSRNVKLQTELAKLAQEQIAQVIQQKYEEFLQTGQEPSKFNPSEALDVDAFVKEFNKNHIDDISAQGQNLLNLIRDITEDELIYAKFYFEFVTFGEAYTHTEIIGDTLRKRVVSIRDAYPVPNDNTFVEDFDMFAERERLTYQQILDTYGEYLDDKQLLYMESFYEDTFGTMSTTSFNKYKDYFPDVCSKISKEDQQFFSRNPQSVRDLNGELYDVWRVVWRGEAERLEVTYLDPTTNLLSVRIENGDYKFNPENGDIEVNKIYEPQVYECVRIGDYGTAIYPFKARAIAYNRGGKLPYNGICELLPGLGRFSIIEEMLPYQVFYNIVAYHRETAIARNRLSVLLIAKSLLGVQPEETIYKMLSAGILEVDDTIDDGLLKSQQVRMLHNDSNNYIAELSKLLDEIEEKAKMQVDMTPQRYGEIATSAGKATTENAIARGSMGSVIIEFMADMARGRDYSRDLDYSKYAWVDGLNTSIKDDNGEMQYISLDVDKHMLADYGVYPKNSVTENDKMEQLKSLAFSAAQNGEMEMAVAAIDADNVASLTKLIEEFSNKNREHEAQMQQMQQQNQQMLKESETQMIQLKGEEDRKAISLKGTIDKEIALIQAKANILSFKGEMTESDTDEIQDSFNASAEEIQREKLQVDKVKVAADIHNKAEDRKLKEKDMKTKETIARVNKNRYDK